MVVFILVKLMRKMKDMVQVFICFPVTIFISENGSKIKCLVKVGTSLDLVKFMLAQLKTVTKMDMENLFTQIKRFMRAIGITIKNAV